MTIPFDIFDTMPRNCWTVIDTGQLTQNARILQRFVDKPTLIVVKSNGYGHGYAHAARAFVEGGVSYLGIATISEGMLLRQLGFTIPLLLICGILPEEMKLAAQLDLDFFVWNVAHIAALREIADPKKPVRVHLKVDTGMGRAGCWPADVAQIATTIQSIKGIEITGLCTHFASADDPDPNPTDQQLAKFDQAIAAVHAAGIHPHILHAANSPGSLYFPRARYDMARFGITAYGIAPDDGLPIPESTKSALTWHARLTSTKILPAGHGVGYGGEYKMPKEGRIGVLPLGYADGFRRSPKNVNSVLINGQERKTLGRICMDQCMIDLSGFDDITGAEAVIIGQQGDKKITSEDIAKRWTTNPYDVFVGIATRVPRQVKASV